MQSRRRILGAMTTLGLATAATGAAALVPTARQARGPFYPNPLPAESDMDLLEFGGGRATGDAIRVSGRVLGRDGRPVPNAAVELWQANTWGRYAHSADGSRAPLDPFFQGYGVVRTDAEGRYAFRTIRPGEYPGRTPHLHFAIQGSGFERLSTQMYFAGDPGNDGDVLLRRVIDPRQRQGLVVAFDASATGEMAGTFDIILGS